MVSPLPILFFAYPNEVVLRKGSNYAQVHIVGGGSLRTGVGGVGPGPIVRILLVIFFQITPLAEHQRHAEYHQQFAHGLPQYERAHWRIVLSTQYHRNRIPLHIVFHVLFVGAKQLH